MNAYLKIAKRIIIGHVIAGDYKHAAIEFVVSQVREQSPNDMWKWWKSRLGRRNDYPEMTRRMLDAILQEYHTGGQLFRETTAKIFGIDKNAASMPVNKFVDAIRRKRVRNFPVPDNFVAISPPPTVSLRRAVKKFRYPKLPIQHNDAVFVDLRKDAIEMTKLLKHIIDFHASEAAKIPQMPNVIAIEIGFYLCQGGWVMIHFDTRPQHQRDGTNFCDEEAVNVPQWKKGHEAAQKFGGTFILPDGKKMKVAKGILCKKLAAIYGGMIKTVLLDAKKSGAFKKLPMREGCQLDVVEFDGMWAWPKYEQLGKINQV